MRISFLRLQLNLYFNRPSTDSLSTSPEVFCRHSENLKTMRKRIDTDTSAICVCLDLEFREDSLALFEAFNSDSVIIVVSNPILAELEEAPKAVLPEQVCQSA